MWKETWINYLTKLYDTKQKELEVELNTPEIVTNSNTKIGPADVNTAIIKLLGWCV